MCTRCEWEGHLDNLNELIESGDYDWTDTLTDIRDWVEENGHISSNQIRAMQNIEAGRQEDDD